MIRYTASDLVSFGYAVLVLMPGTKEPIGELFPHGVYSATRDVARIEHARRRFPGSRLAIQLRDGERVLDEDPRNGGDAELAALKRAHAALPRTPTQRTGGGGRHFVFRAEGRFRTKLGAGVELLSRGKYIVIHEPGWIVGLDEPAAELPTWLAMLAREQTAPSTSRPIVTSTSAYARAALDAEYRSVAGARRGQRNDLLNRASFALARFVYTGELSELEIVETLASAASIAGLRGHEVRRTIQSGIRGRSK